MRGQVWCALELHRRLATGRDAAELLIARRVADANTEAQQIRELALQVVVEANADVGRARRQLRDLDGRRHRRHRHRAPTEAEEARRTDVGEVLEARRDVRSFADTDAHFAAATDGETILRGEHHHAAVDADAFERREPELDPTGDFEAGVD